MARNRYKSKLKTLKNIPNTKIPKMHEDIHLVKDSNKLLLELFDVTMEKINTMGCNYSASN